jgi:predicted MFS family arabinose efflux permease
VTPRLATFSIFAINGAMIGTWVAHIPWLQDHLGISKATLGLCLLCMALGALISMPITGHVVDRRSSASVTRAATLVFCLMLPLPLLATSPLMLAGILFVFGASTGVMDVAMNAHGVAIQSRLERPIMSSLHGGWSLGGFAAAGLVAVAAAAGVDPRLESLVVGVALWLSALWLTRRLGTASTASAAGHGLALPSRPVLLIGCLCFVVMLIEGAIGDWSGIYLRHNVGASTAASAMAFTGFSLGMAVSRLGGDVLNERLGPARLLRAGTALVAIVLAAVLLIGQTVPAVIGFALCGLGLANAVPLLFSAAGRIEPSSPSLAAAFTLGYTGFIVGPPTIGILSDQVSLPRTLTLLVFAALAVTVLGRRAMATGARAPARGHDGAQVLEAADAATFYPGLRRQIEK